MTGVLHTASDTASDKPARCSGGHGFYSCRGLRFSLFHARVMLNISSFTPNYRAQNSPSSFTYHNFVFVNIFMP